jgi:hypothetical protein
MPYSVSGWIEVATEVGWTVARDLGAYVEYGGYASGAMFGLAKPGGWKHGPLHLRALPVGASARVAEEIEARRAFKAAHPSEACSETWCTFEEAKNEYERLRSKDPDFEKDFQARGWNKVFEVAEQLSRDIHGKRSDVRFVLFGDW